MKIHASINRMVNKEDSAIKAYASVTMDGMFAVHGLRVIETEKGRFVNMPSTSYTNKDGNKQYSDTFHAITKSAENCRKSGCTQCLRSQSFSRFSRRISRLRTPLMRKCPSLKMNLSRL